MPRAYGAKAKSRKSALLPTGWVTFLFSDIEGSTQRWEIHADAMAAAVMRHDALMREAIESNGGYVFKTMGDAFCAAFPSATAAIGAALGAQVSLAREDWSLVDGLTVRIGLHGGQTDERNGDYFGPVLNRVARLMSTAHGGQVVLSATVAEQIGESLAPDVSLIDLGTHGLKDLSQPEHVFQLASPDLRSEFPALRSMDARPNNLPVHLTNLIGRDIDIADVVRLLGRNRLVTLAGAGGIGKTRLAQHVGAEMLNDFPDGVWFVELAGLTDPGHVAGAVAAVLGVRSAEDRPPLQSIVDALRHKRTLIILDNCEHVAAACAMLAFTLLQQCPSVRVIDTSRETLHVDGEYVYRVPSLSVPPVRERLTAESAERFGAIALFVERAAATGAGFTLTDANAPIVADICRRLDGIPLAIELAAPRTRVLSLSKVAEKLDDRFRLLEGGKRTAMPRQQTLHALIGWSHDLLSQQEAILFRRLSVFSGTFGIEAATAICADESLPEEDILDVLASLVDKSLLLGEQVIEDQRFRMLESIREFARERLAAANERVGFARRHAEYYCNLAREVRVENRSQDETAAVLRKLDVELDNFRAAMDWNIAEGGDFELGTAIAAELSAYWENRGLESEGLSRLESGLKSLAASEPTVTKAQAFAAIMSLAFPTRQFQRSLDAALRAGEIARELGDQALLGRARRGEGDALSQFGRHDEAALALDEALILLRAAGLDRAVEGCLLDQAMNESARGNYDHARQIYAELDGRFRTQGDTERLCHVAINLAETEFAAGNVAVATTLLEEILPILKASPHFVLAVRCNLASYLLADGEIERGRAAARTSLELCLMHGYSAFAVVPMETLALVAAMGDDFTKAARIFGFTDSVITASGAPRERTEQLTYDRLMAVLRVSLSEKELTNALRAGAAISQETAIAEALEV